MDIKDYFDQMKKVQIKLIEFIENEDDVEEKYENLLKLNEHEELFEDNFKFISLLKLISNIIKNHRRNPNFISKIHKILLLMSTKIKQTFSNFEIFNIFKNNKLTLLFLIEEQIIIIDKSISEVITNEKYINRKYPEYFFNEIKPFIDKNMIEQIEKEFPQEKYEINRQIGENENYICKLIRNDLIEEFITYVNKNDISLSKRIEISIFETNSELLYKNCSLIEYAAFFGSVQIFRYLYLNNTESSVDIWLYAFHGDNPELISFLEDKSGEIDDNLYDKCIKETIKCHHINTTDYLLNKFSNENKLNIVSYAFHYRNFFYIPNNPDSKLIFFYACKYNYFDIVKHFIQNINININETIVL